MEQKLTNEQKLQLMEDLASEMGTVITLKEDPKPPGADPQVWAMLDKPKPCYKDDNRTLKYVVRPRANRSNLRIIFENDDQYQNIQYHDHSTSLLLNGTPIEKATWEDIAIDIEERYRIETNDNMIRSAMYRIGFHNQIFPIRDYLESLVWDGTERLELFAENILQAETSPQDVQLIRAMSTKMFIGPVARIYEPGCDLHSMPIYIGDKGIGKSMVIKLLLPNEDWFGRTKMKIGDKSALEMLHQTGIWLQEIAELADFQGKNASDTKAFITNEADRYRVVYDKDVVKKKRRTCFFGTSNDYQILDDGWERRFWIFKLTGKVDLAWVVANRDQVWAEAVHYYKAGKQWHLNDDETEMLRTYQQTFLVEDAWAWGVSKAIDFYYSDRGQPGATTQQIMDYIELPVSQQHTGNSRRIAQICRDNGYQMKRTAKSRYWCKGRE